MFDIACLSLLRITFFSSFADRWRNSPAHLKKILPEIYIITTPLIFCDRSKSCNYDLRWRGKFSLKIIFPALQIVSFKFYFSPEKVCGERSGILIDEGGVLGGFMLRWGCWLEQRISPLIGFMMAFVPYNTCNKLHTFLIALTCRRIAKRYWERLWVQVS